VSKAAGAPVDIRTGKVLAGLEPENTNQFLLVRASECARWGDARACVRARGREGPVAPACCSHFGRDSNRDTRTTVATARP
jgi:hypothetical protein